ncbi:hypothetical protein CL654_02580 [bacterium]|nr:hypothetical protein [bacterium]
MDPIKLTREGDRLVQGDHLRWQRLHERSILPEDSPIGVHQTDGAESCNGDLIRFLDEEGLQIVCKRCAFTIDLPGGVSSYRSLRQDREQAVGK